MTQSRTNSNLCPGGREGLTVKEWIEIGTWIVAIVGGALAAFVAVYQIYLNRQQRNEELRWKKASVARELMAEIHQNPHAAAAIHMLDWWGSERIVLQYGERQFVVGTADIRRAMAKPRASISDETSQFVSDAFDWFLYYIDRVGHFERITLLEEGDVMPVFGPYLTRLQAEEPVFRRLIEAQQYQRAAAMIAAWPKRQAGGEMGD
jgi:hypothetical protein